jgi:Na+-driven multidrug efflux pump
LSARFAYAGRLFFEGAGVMARERGSLAELVRLASPVVLSRLGIMTMGLTDAIIVGHHS